MLKRNTPTVSSFCHWDQPQCVQVTFRDDGFAEPRILVTDTKLGYDSPVERYTQEEWAHVLANLGERRPDPASGMFQLGQLRFTSAEWAAFKRGVHAGEFATS